MVTGEKRYRDFSDFLNLHFDCKVQKISLHAGFTCPNRDGSIGVGGCTYCNNQTFSPDYCHTGKSITSQLEEGIAFFARKYPEMHYLAYFQAYTNTYGELAVLKQKYEEALSHPGVVGIIVGTRPDCMLDGLLEYFADLSRHTFVLVEYGVESTCDETLRRVNRGHDFAVAEQAIRATAGRGITIGAHLIFGLPGESRESMLEGAIRLCELPIQVLKLHQLQIVKGTRLAEQYLENPALFRLYTLDEYLDFVVEVIERIRSDVYLERFVNQSPPEYLIAPQWGIKNFEFTAKLDKRLEELDTWQGRLKDKS